MTQRFLQPHAQNYECSPMHDVKFTPRLQCPIPSSSMHFPLSAMINLDSRTPCAVLLDITEHNMDHITSLERSLCSNFFCCGVQLADFHALLEHFEENHVVVLAPNGKRVYPREGLRAVPLDPASGTSTPSSSRASSVSPASPLSPQTPLSPSPSSPLSQLPAISPPVSRKSSFTVPPVYTPFTPSLPVDPADPLLDSSEIVMSQEPDFDFSLHPSFLPPLAPEISSEHAGSSSSEDEGTNMANGSDHLLSGRHVRFLDAQGVEKRRMDRPMSKSGKSRRHHPSGSHSKRREKMYRCPKNGCVKAYLNPNGLKYHLEKGTCKFAEDEDDALQERADPPKRSRQASPSSPNSAPLADNAYHSQVAYLSKTEERSLVNAMATDSDPLQEGSVPQPLSHYPHSAGPSSNNNNNYGHHPVAMNPTWRTPHTENPCAHPYPHPVEVATAAPHFKHEQEEHPSSPPAPPSQPSPRSSVLGQSVPQQYMPQLPQQQIQYHYPVPTYPNGYIYAQQQHRPYFASERATYEPSAPLVANGAGVAPPSSQ